MILTLAWKELREHQGIWLTMVDHDRRSAPGACRNSWRWGIRTSPCRSRR